MEEAVSRIVAAHLRRLEQDDRPARLGARQCELLGLNRSSLYYRERPARVEDAEIMRRLDAQYTETPFYGYRRMRADRISRSGTKRRSRFIETGLKTKQQRSRKG
jgi:hypothetical protein